MAGRRIPRPRDRLAVAKLIRDIAEGTLFPVSDDANYITGQTLAIDGGGTLQRISEGTLKID